MGIVQDTLLGARLMTKRDMMITKDVFMNILMWVDDWDGIIPMPAILKPVPLWCAASHANAAWLLLVLPERGAPLASSIRRV
jgi:hypothetical protein